MKRIIVALLAAAVFVLAGCGGGTANSDPNSPPLPTPSATMKTGQWEFVLMPTESTTPYYVEANLAGGNTNIYSTAYNTLVFEFGSGIAGGTFSCGAVTSNQVGSNNGFSGTLSAPTPQPSGVQQPIAYTATLATSGQALSNGLFNSTYSGQGLCSVPDTGTFNGYVVSPLDGTFTGTLTGSDGSAQISIQILQNADFGITASGTLTNAEGSYSISIAASASGDSNVIGATMSASGTTSDVNSNALQMTGHFNPAATQIQVWVNANGGQPETGTLTKQ